jgi:hypothetical protein
MKETRHNWVQILPQSPILCVKQLNDIKQNKEQSSSQILPQSPILYLRVITVYKSNMVI